MNFLIFSLNCLTSTAKDAAFLFRFPRFPFDWKNLLGFIVAANVLFIFQLDLVHFAISGVALGVSDFLFVTSLTREIKNDLNAFAKLITSKPNPMRLYPKLVDALQFHSTVIRYYTYKYILR